MCHSKRQGPAIAAIDKFSKLLPAVSGYLDAEMVPMFPFFAETFRGDAFIFGYQATLVAESINHMMKRDFPPHIHNLTEIRDSYTRSHPVKVLGMKHRMERQSCREHFLRTLVRAPVSRVLCDLIDARVHESGQWYVIRSLHNDDEFEVTVENEKRWMIRTDTPDPRCECNKTSGTGRPCPHLIVLHSQFGEQFFPIAFIAGLWLPGVPTDQIPCLPILTLKAMDDFRRRMVGDGLEEIEATDTRLYESEDPYEQENDRADEHAQDLSPADQPPGNCLHLLYPGKQIAQKGADASSRYKELSTTLMNILESLMEPRNGERRDAKGR
jgi:hypothetical protein